MKNQKLDIKQRIGNIAQKISNSLSKKSSFSFGSEVVTSVNGVPVGNIRISVDVLYTIWRNHSDVFAAIRELSGNVGSNGYKWENRLDSEKDPNPQQVKAAEAILASGKSMRKLKKRLIRDVHVSGNAYLLIQKNQSGGILSVQPMDPRTISVVTDQSGKVLKWIQRVGTKSQDLLPDEVVQWKLEDDPNSPVFGLSPLEPIIWEIRTDLAAMMSNYVFFQNDAQPAAQYILDENLSDDEAKKAMESIEDKLKGAENRHRSIAMKGVKEIKQLSVNQKDMEFHVLRRFSVEKVCSALGVPKSILNYTDDVNYANGENQKQKFWEGTIAPLEEDFMEMINNDLLPAIGCSDIKLRYNDRRFDTEGSVREDLKLGIITINEARQKRGMDFYDAADAGEFVDKPILFAGAAAVPVLDVGVDPQLLPEPVDQSGSQKMLNRIEGFAQKYLYGRSKA